MLDRIGPRIIIASFSFMGALGAFLFAFGTSFTSALLGRIFIGVGMSSVMMGSLKVFVLRFSPDRFATLMGILVSIGTLGIFWLLSISLSHLHHWMENNLHPCGWNHLLS